MKPLYKEHVAMQRVLTLKNEEINSDKIYIVEVVTKQEEGKCLENWVWNLRVRYGRNDGRKLRMMVKKDGWRTLDLEWAFSAQVKEKLDKGYSYADPFLALTILAADDQRQRIEPITDRLETDIFANL